MSPTHEIRIFCPLHEAAFDVEKNPKILCAITGHTLANDFPSSEIWEFCCNCNTFSPTKLDKGEKARGYCFSCQSEIAKRTLCSKCKTSSFASKSKSKGQQYFIDEDGLTPYCPGCGEKSPGKPQRHKCEEASAVFLTSVETCPFCLEKTSVDFVLVNRPSSHLCPRCDATNPETAPFCGKCGYPLKAGAIIEKAGTVVPRTAVGTLCPNCSLPMPPDSDFCGECGQAVKQVPIPGPPPPPPPPQGAPSTTEPAKPSRGTTASSGLNINPAVVVSIILGGLFVFILSVIAITSSMNSNVAANNASRSNANNYNTAANAMANAANAMAIAANTMANAANRAANSVSMNANTTRFSNPMIGKTATLSWDVAMRPYPGEHVEKHGIQYKGARVRVIDVDDSVPNSDGGVARWYKVKVLSYGTSVDSRNGSLEKDPGTADEGWLIERRDVYIPPELRKMIRKKVMLIFDR